MPYYSAGDYYRGDYYQGDNYAAGGLFGSIGKFIGGVARTVIGATPLGGVVNALVPSFNRPQIAHIQQPIVPVPGLTGFGQRLIPGGASGYMVARRRRLNPLNIKALRRAMRRAKGFEKQARRVGTYFNPGKAYKLKGRKRRPAA
jgi:hypothetical protein